tara:strand:+ start:2830 stop:3747 length:918 start_codon:yes stop_codon:yes gene_type:complete
MPIKLVAPPHTPFTPQGELNLEVVELQAKYFFESGISGVFVCGSTGEGQSLSLKERMVLTERWVEAARPKGLEVIVQVGSNCQPDAVRLAAHALETGANSIASLAPSYFKPATVDDLIEFFEPIAKAAQPLPFYFYDIPVLTGVTLSTVEFLERAHEKLPNLAGVKYTNEDLLQFQKCLQVNEGHYEIWFGCDEALLDGYILGAVAAIGSTYNFAAPLYLEMIDACDSGDIEKARQLQAKSVELIQLCQAYGFSAAAKVVMSVLGIDCGPSRSPLRNLSTSQKNELIQQLTRLDVLAPCASQINE